MLFNSVDFFIFFPAVTFIYFVLPSKFKWVWLLLSSYYFYMSWNPKFVLLLAATTIITYLSGLLIEWAESLSDKAKSARLKKFFVFISFASNLGILFLFKYYNFFTGTLADIFAKLNITLRAPSLDLLLPAGISFYTFQALSYTMDVYRRDVKAEKNIGKYALYVSFFPQLLAGPIQKSKNFLHQFEEKHCFDYDRVKSGLLLMIWGYFQKVFIADRLSVLVKTVYDKPSDYKGFEIVIATVFFAFQLYCDFSAYSDIARGAAEVLGFRLSKNFERPYFSKSIKEFWRRWHITLCSWFKDYLYIPLGGNRRGKPRYYINVLIVFLVSGLWHGAAINFIIWGGLHGLYQIIGDILKPFRKKITEILNIKTNVFSYKLLQVLTTFALVDFAWIFFRANSFHDAEILIGNMISFNPWIFTNGGIYKLGLDSKDFTMAVIGISIVLIANLMQRNGSMREKVSNQNPVFRWVMYVTAILVILIFGIYGGYSAQQFIYFQF